MLRPMAANKYHRFRKRRSWRSNPIWRHRNLMLFAAAAAAISYSYLAGGGTVAELPEQRYYPNCDAARSAGAAPISKGSPGYRPELDADSDGIACEPYP